ncbi:MAG: hypothetical protein PUE04_10200 [Lachnospira sp.]|nr:hypothetical protein [Lachnospira sp.]
MEKPLSGWAEKYGNNFIRNILRDDFHAVNFDYNGLHYTFSGWWLLDVSDGSDKIYDSKTEFLNDPIFDGKTIQEINPENADFEFEP